MIHRIDLDHGSASAIRPEVLAAMLPVLETTYGNPSSVHLLGREARQLLDAVTDTLAGIVGRGARELTFTGSATEALNLGVLGWLRPNQHVVVSAIEHHAVLEAAREHVRRGGSLTVVVPDGDGIVRPASVASALRDETALVAVMAANNEIGTVQPISEIATLCRSRGVRLLVDATAAVGALDLHELAQCAEMLVLSAAKIGGPKGVGVLVAPEKPELHPMIFGGGQQHRRRSGTENLPGIVGLVRAIELAEAERGTEVPRQAALRDGLLETLRGALPGLQLHGHPTRRLPGNLHIGVPGIDAELLVVALDREGICCSSGAACTAPMVEPSHVLEALGLPPELVRTGVRFTLGRTTTAEEVQRAGETILRVASGLL